MFRFHNFTHLSTIRTESCWKVHGIGGGEWSERVNEFYCNSFIWKRICPSNLEKDLKQEEGEEEKWGFERMENHLQAATSN